MAYPAVTQPLLQRLLVKTSARSRVTLAMSWLERPLSFARVVVNTTMRRPHVGVSPCVCVCACLVHNNVSFGTSFSMLLLHSFVFVSGRSPSLVSRHSVCLCVPVPSLYLRFPCVVRVLCSGFVKRT